MAKKTIPEAERIEIKTYFKSHFGDTLKIAAEKFNISIPTAAQIWHEAFKECYSKSNQTSFTQTH
jgi:hypothetical protein